VARALAPAALGVLCAAHTAAGLVYYRTQPFRPAQMVLSSFESPEDNPRGYWVAAGGTGVACALLLLAAPALRRAAGRSGWSAAGACVYAGGAASGVAMAALEPQLDPFHPLHILLAFMTFVGLCGGLALLAAAAARARLRPGRAFWRGAAVLYVAAVLIALDVVPLPSRGCPGFLNSLAAGEMALVLLIGAGTWGIAAADASASREASARPQSP
jgi:hypothetical protein